MTALVVDRLPAPLRSARVRPSGRAAAGLLIVIAAVGAVLGLRLAMASAASRPVPVPDAGAPVPGAGASAGETAGSLVRPTEPPGSAASVGSAGSVGSVGSAVPTLGQTGPATGGPAGAAAGSTPSTLLVQVAGRVRHPGVVRLPPGARVQDALRAAGGALAGSDLVGINLAEPVADGEQVLVARAGGGSTVTLAGAAAGAGSGSAPPAGAGGAGVVDLNTGDVTALDALPGVGPVLAQRIADWRNEHGRFTSIDELDEVSGIGAKMLAEIRPHVRL